ncbi:hypothetical protein B0O80DRAFT_460818 [Mortierella sp. GBAus27b]|nr:hypothetical protein B0O80DRAFT_460818 [Mortierella sp. GBAus27b]
MRCLRVLVHGVCSTLTQEVQSKLGCEGTLDLVKNAHILWKDDEESWDWVFVQLVCLSNHGVRVTLNVGESVKCHPLHLIHLFRLIDKLISCLFSEFIAYQSQLVLECLVSM